MSNRWQMSVGIGTHGCSPCSAIYSISQFESRLSNEHLVSNDCRVKRGDYDHERSIKWVSNELWGTEILKLMIAVKHWQSQKWSTTMKNITISPLCSINVMLSRRHTNTGTIMQSTNISEQWTAICIVLRCAIKCENCFTLNYLSQAGTLEHLIISCGCLRLFFFIAVQAAHIAWSIWTALFEKFGQSGHQ